MLLWLLGCAYKGIPMPGTPRHLSGYVQKMATSKEPSQPQLTPDNIQKSTSLGELVAQSAINMKGESTLIVEEQSYRFDCSGFVLAAHAQSKLVLEGNTRSLFEQSKSLNTLSTESPLPGDVVFFNNTYDRNNNGKLDDELTHIAIVVTVEEDGTVSMIHLGGSGVTSLTMNVQHPDDHRSPQGTIWNGYLRVNKAGEDSPRLAGQLFLSYGRLWTPH